MSRGKQVRAPLSHTQRKDAARIVATFVALRAYLDSISKGFARAGRELRAARARRPHDVDLVRAYQREASMWRRLFDEALATVYGPAPTLNRRLEKAAVVRHLDEAVSCAERLLSPRSRGTVAGALRRDDHHRLASHVRAILLIDGAAPGAQLGIVTDVRHALADPPTTPPDRRTRRAFLVACAVVADLTERVPVPLERLITRFRKADHHVS